MAKNKRTKIGRPTKDEGPKLSNPDEVLRLLVEGEVAPDKNGEAKRVWPSQREVAARFGVSASTIAEFAKQHDATEKRAELQVQLHTPERPSAKADEGDEPEVEARDVVRASISDTQDVEDDANVGRRRPGRPRHQDAPVIPFEELDRLLVHGEVQLLEDGKRTTVFPTYRELADKYGVVPSVIAEYAKRHNTMKRRKLAEARVEKRTDEKIVELRSDAMAFGDARLLELIDAFLVEFEKALKEGRVRADSPADVNTLVRLRSFLQGGADSRAEVQNSLSLEVLSEKHERYLRDVENSTPAMAGVVLDLRAEEPSSETEQPNTKPSARFQALQPPGPSIRDGSAEPNLSHDLRGALRDLVNLARELAEQLGADPDDAELIENRVLRAAETVEAELGAPAGADVGPTGAIGAEDEG